MVRQVKFESNFGLNFSLLKFIFCKGNSVQTTAPTLVRQISNPNFIKQSLERELQGKNLIGDRSRVHILPPIISKKHPDLNCISPDTVKFLLDK